MPDVFDEVASAPPDASDIFDLVEGPAPRTEAAVQETHAVSVGQRMKALAEGAGIPTSVEGLKETGKFLIRSPIQDVKDIYQDVTQMPERVRNLGQTLSASPAAHVYQDPGSVESFRTYGTVIGMLFGPKAGEIAGKAFKRAVARPNEPAATMTQPEAGTSTTEPTAPPGALSEEPLRTTEEVTISAESVPKNEGQYTEGVRQEAGPADSGGNVEQAPSRESDSGPGAEVEPPIPPDHVRLYHGANIEIGQAGRDFTTSRQYAQGYADKSGEHGGVWYVDVPEGKFKTHDEYGMPMTRVILPDEVTDQAKILSKNQGGEADVQQEGQSAQNEQATGEKGGQTNENLDEQGRPVPRDDVNQDAVPLGGQTVERGGEPVLTDADRTFIEDRIRQEVRAGIEPVEAAKIAVGKHLEHAKGQLSSIYEQAGVKPSKSPVESPEGKSAVPGQPAAENAVAGRTGGGEATSDEPHVSTIANRFVKERVASGTLGEVAPGKGYSTTELVEHGLKMAPEEIAQHVSDLVQGRGDPIRQGMAVRAEEARLSKRSADLSRAAEANPKNVEAKLAADNAFKDVQDFHNGPVARLKQNWHAQGMGLQGEIPVDLSTFNGLREAWLKDTGKPPPPNVEATLKRTAKNVAESVEAENGARSRLAAEVDKATTRRKLPTADEVRNNIRERMGLEPCR